MALQIRHELRQVAWLVGSTHKVFGTQHDRVLVCTGSPAEDWAPPGFPFALVVVQGGTPDPEHPDLIEQNFSVISAAEVSGDPYGHQANVGGSAGELGKSAGRGILEIAARVRAAVGQLVGVDGAKILLSSTSTGATESLGRGRHMAFDELGLTAKCTSQLHYAEPQEIKEASATWTWEGTHCADRFDFVQFRLGYVSGSSPTQNPGDATIVYTGTDETTTHTPIVGTNTYSIWADYNARAGMLDTSTSTVEGSSDGRIVGSFTTTVGI